MIAQQESPWEQLAQQVVGEMRRVWEAGEQAGSAEQLEQVVLEWRARAGGMVMQALCQEAVGRKEQAQVPICCGGRMDHHSRRAKTVLTLLGAVRVVRRYYRCLRCGGSRFPADGWLGWESGFSHHLQEAVAWECSLLPYREALGSLEKLAGVELSVLGAERMVARWGKQELAPAPYGERVDKDLVIQLDGTTAHLEEGWREIKLAACFSWDREDPEREPEAVSYTADWESAEEFGETLWQEALARGAPTARAQAVIGDGAAWVWELAGYLFPHATQILDWYHVSEHLWAGARVVHGEGSEQTKGLVECWKSQLREGFSEGVEEHLRELVAAGYDDAEATLRKCADYLQTHQSRLRYHLFEAAGWPTGSGVVEGGCKHVVGMRFKRKSTRWTKQGARAVLHLRLDRLNGRWQTRCHLMRRAA
jgi:hypothetical protein